MLFTISSSITYSLTNVGTMVIFFKNTMILPSKSLCEKTRKYWLDHFTRLDKWLNQFIWLIMRSLLMPLRLDYYITFRNLTFNTLNADVTPSRVNHELTPAFNVLTTKIIVVAKIVKKGLHWYVDHIIVSKKCIPLMIWRFGKPVFRPDYGWRFIFSKKITDFLMKYIIMGIQ